MKENTKYENVNFNDFPLISCTIADGAELLFNSLNNGKSYIYSHINIYNYYLFTKNLRLFNELKPLGHFFFDGIALKLGSFWLGKGWKNDVNGTDIFPVLMEMLTNSNIKIFLLGAEEIVIEKAFQNTLKNYPGIHLSGFRNGYFRKEDESNIVNSINKYEPDLLIIGRGMLQEAEFILRNHTKLNVKMIWNVGGLFDFVSGNKPRAPYWMRKLRLEWLFRFLLEPRRMFFRYITLSFWLMGHLLKLKIIKSH